MLWRLDGHSGQQSLVCRSSGSGVLSPTTEWVLGLGPVRTTGGTLACPGNVSPPWSSGYSSYGRPEEKAQACLRGGNLGALVTRVRLADSSCTTCVVPTYLVVQCVQRKLLSALCNKNPPWKAAKRLQPWI